ncbi:hypothetical protein D3C78_683260 [compost metagenome]
MALDGVLPALRAQVGEIAAHALRAGQHDQVGRRDGLAGADEAQLHLRVQAQRVEVGVVADARQHRHDHLEHALILGRLAYIDAVFGLKVQVADIRQHTQHRLARALLQPVQAWLQQGDVATETVDDEALDPGLLGRRQQLQGTDQVGEDAAAIDVGNQNHRAVDRFGKTHVGDVTGTQVDLGRRARTFDHHHRIRATEALMGGQHRLHGDSLVVVIGHRVHAGDRAAMDDDLGAGVTVGLEQHRVHVGVRRQPASLGLHRLGATDLTAIGSHRAVEGHVLRFERHHGHPLAQQPTAQGGNQRALAGVGGGALHHEGGHAVSF